MFQKLDTFRIDTFPEFNIQYPEDWEKDNSLEKQSVCKQTDVNCLVSYVHKTKTVQAVFSAIALPRVNSKSLEELALDSWDNGSKTIPGIYLIATESIRLNDGSVAFQILSGYPDSNGIGLILSVSILSDETFYVLDGTVMGETVQAIEQYQAMLAIARSFSLK